MRRSAVGCCIAVVAAVVLKVNWMTRRGVQLGMTRACLSVVFLCVLIMLFLKICESMQAKKKKEKKKKHKHKHKHRHSHEHKKPKTPKEETLSSASSASNSPNHM